MNAIRQRATKPTVFYGWFVLITSFVMLFFNAGAQFSIGVMFKPILGEFNWSRGTISLVVFVNMVLYALSMLIMGKAYDRFGPKRVILAAVLFLGSGFIGIATMNSLPEFVLYYGVLCGIGFGGCTTLVVSSLVSKWFDKWRGLMISVALSGGCLGQFVLIPFYTNLVLTSGWRTTYLLIGCLTFLVNSLAVLLVIRGDPIRLGYRPFGAKATREDASTSRLARSLVEPDKDFGLKEALKTGSFWLYVITMFVCGAGDFLVSTHLIAFVTDFEVSQQTAGGMLAWLGLFSLIGILVAGYLADRIGSKLPIVGTFVIRIFLFVMILLVQNTVTFYIFALGFGFTMLMTAVLTVTLIGHIFGFSQIGTLTGFITTIHHLGGGVLVYLGGVVFDRTNSYQAVFILYCAMSLIAVFSSALIRERRHPLRGQ